MNDAIHTSIARKFLMGLTGLFLVVFLLVHLIGNLLVLKSDAGAAFNAYSELLLSSVFIRIVEYGLVVGFLLHIILGVILSFENKKARPVGYAVNRWSANSSWYSRHMKSTGGIILIFLVVHLETFFYHHRIVGTDHTMYESVVLAFQSLPYSLFYIAAMVLLAFHLMHGFESAFQTLGLRHNKYTPLLSLVGKAFSILVPAGFAAIPIVAILGGLS